MMKRPFWLGTGVVLGVAGTLWAEQRVRRAVDQTVAKLTPTHMATEAAQSVRQLGDRVRAAVEEGRQERARREAELWDELDAGHLRGGTARTRPAAGSPARSISARAAGPAQRGRHVARGAARAR